MTSSFLDNLTGVLNTTRTENGAVTNKSSLDAVVDFYALAGAMRDRPAAAADLFEAAYLADPLTAVRTMFYLRDVRGGQGERKVFRACLDRLALIDADTYAAVLHHVPFYGRWDDVLHLGVTEAAVDLIREQWNEDVDALHRGESVSLLAKWMPSVKTSSAFTRALAAELSGELGLLPVHYRQTLTALRGRIKLLETQMSENDWKNIDYGKLPSQAHRRHTKAFLKHTAERYQKYLSSVAKGEQKINVKTVFPHEIWQMVNKNETEYANVAWETLPDYTQGNNAIVMADTSASMTWHNNARAMAVAVSLACYFAERNSGPFKGYFMTFAAQPQLVKVTGKTVAQRFRSIQNAHVGGNTDLMAAFRAILAAGLKSPEDMPKVLYVISDMEFDQAVPQGRPQYQPSYKMVQNPYTGRMQLQLVNVPVAAAVTRDSVFEVAKAEFAAHGLTLPHVVFWNVEARQNQTPALAHDGNVTLVSGLSPTTFSQVVEGKTPRQLVDDVVNGERYQRITL